MNAHDFEPGFFEDSIKDVSDKEWAVFTENIIRLAPWLIFHSIGKEIF